MSEAQNPFFITHDNQITIIPLTHVNIPFKMEKYNDDLFCSEC